MEETEQQKQVTQMRGALAKAEMTHKMLRMVLDLDPKPAPQDGRNPLEDLFSGFGSPFS